MRYFIFFIVLIFVSCAEEKQKIVNGIILKQWWHVSEHDTLLVTFHVADKKHVGLSGSNTRHSLENYTSQVSKITAFKLINNQLEFAYQLIPKCVDKSTCGTRQNDKIMGIGDRYTIYKCYCENRFSILDLKNGKEDISFSAFFSNIFENDSVLDLRPIHADLAYLDLTLHSGKKVYFSLNDAKEISFKREFDYLWNKQIYFSEFDEIKDKISIRISEKARDLSKSIQIKTAKNTLELDKLDQHALFEPKLILDKNTLNIMTDGNSFYVIFSNKLNTEWNSIAKINFSGEMVWCYVSENTFSTEVNIQLLKNGYLALANEKTCLLINSKGEIASEIDLAAFTFE